MIAAIVFRRIVASGHYDAALCLELVRREIAHRCHPSSSWTIWIADVGVLGLDLPVLFVDLHLTGWRGLRDVLRFLNRRNLRLEVLFAAAALFS